MRFATRRLIAVVAGVVIAGSACQPTAEGPHTPSPTPTALATPPAASPAASPPPSGTYENATLGYRLTLPAGYRRSIARIITSQDGILGVDAYTTVTEAAARERCQADTGDIPIQAPDQDPGVRVGVSRNVLGISAVEWVTTPRVPGAQPLSTHQKVEPMTLSGHEAVRLVEDNASANTTAFVVRANDRMYEIATESGIPPRLPKTWLDGIIATFVAIQPAAFPSPTASIAPQAAAATLTGQLATAFKAADADAVARLLPSCWLAAWPLVDGQAPGGILNRSVSLFTQGLRDRFAAGNLTVTVDPTVQRQPQRLGPDRLFVSSRWKEPDGTTQIDLFLMESDGRWLWSEAVHHYTRAQMQARPVWFCRSPWITGPDRC